MPSYRIFFDRAVEKDLAKFPKIYVHSIMKRVLALAGDPRPNQSLKLDGTVATYRLRVGDYRVIYQIDDKNKIVTIYHVRHRKEAYRFL